MAPLKGAAQRRELFLDLSQRRAVVWQLAEAMNKKHVSKACLAKLLHPGRTQVDGLLDPESEITLSSLQCAAALVGRQARLELV